MVYLSNAFSLGMLKGDGVLRVQQIPLEEAVKILSSGFTSAVGHQSTAKVIEELTGIPIPVNRIAITLQKGDTLVVFQLLTRLPEGAVLTTEEIEKLPFQFFTVEVVE
ncbi:protein of unknown function (DUF1874) [Candidatus Fervidibacteria bacterium JGI MDM2 JNZ-1-D12]